MPFPFMGYFILQYQNLCLLFSSRLHWKYMPKFMEILSFLIN